ncbi:unnamed protein product [Parajaminaea phylloscopi]
MASCRALARTAARATGSTSRARFLATSSRCLRPSAVPTEPASSSSKFPAPASSAAAIHPSAEAVIQPQTSDVAEATKAAPRPVSRIAKAKQLARWSWLSEAQLQEVKQAIDSSDAESQLPEWLDSEHQAARSYRSARSRLWLPAQVPEGAEAGPDGSVLGWVDAKVIQRGEQLAGDASKSGALNVWHSLSLEEQRDEVLKDVWKGMTAEERRNAFIECRFTCLRKLGWRKGYSAGYPVASSPEDAERRAELVAMSSGPQTAEAFVQLQERDEEAAWKDWVRMDAAEREAEERDAWSARDRSTLFIDDSPTSAVLGDSMPRWYATPQRAGELVFLPNFIIRLVRNTTPRGKPYDPWKATFRVPLNLHKHLVRSYLLAVYGLRTTWIRSMIYRSALSRDSGRRLTAGKGRTFKKIEVGLLEPFVFPAITEAFKKHHLYDTEMKFETSKSFIKFTSARRWRGGKSFEPTPGQARVAAESDELVQVDPEDATVEKARPVSLNHRKRIPTKRHGTILRMIEERRKERMSAIDAKAEEIRQQRGSDPSQTA